MLHRISYIYLAAALVVPASAEAHYPGRSTGDFVVAEDGHVDASLELAGREVFEFGELDANHDGVLTQREVDDARPELARLVTEGVEVRADGARCPPRFVGATVTDVDGLTLGGTYACAPGASTIEVTLYFLSELGAGHKHVVRLAAEGAPTAGSTAVLTATSRALTLEIPPELRARAPKAHRAGLLALSIGVATAVVLGAVAFCVAHSRRETRQARHRRRRWPRPGDQ